MKILSIDTSCDETAAAVVDDTKILSNVIWSQASAHAKFGGVMPSLAQRMHSEHIDWVVARAMTNAKCQMENVDCIAVTVGPGLSIALGVGIAKAKELALKFNKPLIPINHVEAHLLSSFAISNFQFPISNKLPIINFPSLGLVVSGGNTQLILIKNIGEYEILAETQDDALGEALDKGARLLGLGYPGGAVLEKMAKLGRRPVGAYGPEGNPKIYSLPVPLVGDKIKNRFSYSGLKTAFVRLVSSIPNPTKENIYNLAASYQDVAFKHIENVLSYQIVNCKLKIDNFLLGGGVAANTELRKRLRKLLKTYNIKLHVPTSKKLLGDNAAMIGVCANLKIKYQSLKLEDFMNYDLIDRKPNLKIRV